MGFAKAFPDVLHAYLYGEPGEDQAGIDVVAELLDGRTRVYQCRKRKSFGPKVAAKTIDEAEFEADEYVIVVTRSVSRKVRDLLRDKPGWTLFDKEDICQSLRSDFDRERSRNLVEDAFGAAWRRAFLGPSGSLVFVEPERYFAPFDNENALLRHTWSFVGRQAVLEELADAVQSEHIRAVVVPGRGGIGKTRLLRALTDRLAEERPLFLSDSATLSPEDVEALPFARTMVLVDDVQGRTDLASLFDEAVRRTERLTLVLAARPQRTDELVGSLARSGFSADEIKVFEPLDELSALDREALSCEALGPDFADHAEALARATADCPLVTVVGGQLLATRAVAPALLERETDFRTTVLDRWRAEAVGELSARVEPRTAALVLNQLAALAPVSVEDDSTLSAMASEAGVEMPALRRVFGELESGGLLVARGRLRRIVPDVLADHILHRACLDAQDRPTGYAEELMRRYGGASLPSLLRNLGELDWRIGRTAGATTLLDTVWGDLEQALLASAAPPRVALLDLLRPVAVFQPARVLALVDLALNHPASAATSPGLFSASFDNGDVIGKLPELLRAVGLHPEHIRQVLEMLWRIGKDQSGLLHSHPNHPLRVAQELGGYERTPAHNEALVGLVEDLASSSEELDAHEWSPLNLLEPLLRREGRQLQSIDFRIQVGSYQVLAEPTAAVRERAARLLETSAEKGTPRNRWLAAKLLGDALDQPHGISGQPVAREHFDQWLPEQLRLLEQIERLVREGDPLVRMQLRQEVKWHAQHGGWPDAQARAQAVLDIPPELDELILEAIAHPWDHSGGFENMENIQAHVRELASTLAALPVSDDSLAEQMDGAVTLLTETRQVEPHPASLLAFLGAASAPRAQGLAGWLLAHPERPLATQLHVLLVSLREAGPAEWVAALNELRNGDTDARRQLAAFLAAGAWFDDPEPEELSALAELLRDEDVPVRSNALLTLLRYGRVDRTRSSELALTAELGDDPGLADLFSQVLLDGNLAAEHHSTVLEKLLPVRELEYFSGQLLAHLGEEVPEQVVVLLIERAQRGHEPEFEPVPFHRIEDDLLRGANDEEYLGLLREVCQAVHKTDDGLVRHHLGSVFWQLDRDLDLSLLVLREWLILEDEQRLGAAASVLQDMTFGHSRPGIDAGEAWSVLLERPWFIIDLVERRQERVRRTLANVMTAGTFGRSLGAPAPRWQQTRDEASRLAALLPHNTEARRFYEWLATSSQQRLDEDRLDDEEYGEGLL